MLAQQLSESEIISACGEEPGVLCRLVADQFGSANGARLAELLVGTPARIIFIVLATWLVSRLVRRSVRRVGAKVVRERAERRARQPQRRRQHPAVAAADGGAVGNTPAGNGGRSDLRITTVVSVFASLAGMVVWTIGLLVMLGEFDVNVAPLLAGAGVVGIALGFGAQSVVADFLAGAFMLLEDQYGVGDVIDVGEATGSVEDFSLRTTTLRDVNGTLWHVPNSRIQRVANKSQFWSRAVLDIDVAYDTDLRRAEGIIQRVADDLWQDLTFTGGTIIDPPEVWGIERLGPDGVTIRLVVKTDPAEQWVVARELRLRIKDAFDQAGVEIPFPQRTVWVRQDQGPVPRNKRPWVPVTEPRLPAVTEEMSINPDFFN